MARARELILKPQKRKPCAVKAIDGETELAFALALLSGDQTAKIVTAAADYAKSHGGTGAPDDPQFLRGKYAHTLLASAIDLDSPESAPVAFFDDVAQIQRMLDDAWIVYACEQQRDFQLEYAPSPAGFKPEEFTVLIAASTEAWKRGADPEAPFVGLPPNTLRSLAATLVLRCTTLTELLSPRGSSTDSGASDPESSPSSATPSEEPN
jgi:hypothetical protein